MRTIDLISFVFSSFKKTDDYEAIRKILIEKEKRTVMAFLGVKSQINVRAFFKKVFDKVQGLYLNGFNLTILS